MRNNVTMFNAENNGCDKWFYHINCKRKLILFLGAREIPKSKTVKTFLKFKQRHCAF